MPTKTKRAPSTVTRAAWYKYLWQCYGLTPEKYDELVQSACGLCEICRCQPRKPAVDHDHKTGHVRGFLCSGCNIGLGFYERGHRRWLRFMPRWTLRFWNLPDLASRVGAYLYRARELAVHLGRPRSVDSRCDSRDPETVG